MLRLKWRRNALWMTGLITIHIFYLWVISPLLSRAFRTDIMELPRPGVEVLLGGDRVDVIDINGYRYSGVISFYTQDGLAVAFAHNIRGLATMTPEIRLDSKSIPGATVVFNGKSGVVLRGIPLPEDRQVLPLGGTADIALGEMVMVYPMHREPYEVTVRDVIGGKGGMLLRALLVPARFSDRGTPTMSGSPVVQKGVIFAFVDRGVWGSFGLKFQAVLAVELWEELNAYLTLSY